MPADHDDQQCGTDPDRISRQAHCPARRQHQRAQACQQANGLPAVVGDARPQRVGLRAQTPGELDAKILEMIDVKRPVLFDCRVDPTENCYPMIPSGAAHNEMILCDAQEEEMTALTRKLEAVASARRPVPGG